MARKNDVEKVQPVDDPQAIVDSAVEEEQQFPVQIISDSEAIHLKLNRIIELLSQK